MYKNFNARIVAGDEHLSVEFCDLNEENWHEADPVADHIRRLFGYQVTNDIAGGYSITSNIKPIADTIKQVENVLLATGLVKSQISIVNSNEEIEEVANENKKMFFARVLPRFPRSIFLKIKAMYILAKYGHRSQKRKQKDASGNQQRYFEHVRRAALILMDELKIFDANVIMALLGHDTWEDTEDIDYEFIESIFGPDITFLIMSVSKMPEEGYHDRLRSAIDWRILLIKGCDRLDNLRSLVNPDTTIEFQLKQIKETIDVYYPLFDKMIDLAPKHYAIAAMKLRQLIHSQVDDCQLRINVPEPV